MAADEEAGPKRIVRYEDLNLLGKTVFLAGGVANLAYHVLDRAINRTVDVIVAAEKAFNEGKNADIDEARVLEEREEHRR